MLCSGTAVRLTVRLGKLNFDVMLLVSALYQCRLIQVITEEIVLYLADDFPFSLDVGQLKCQTPLCLSFQTSGDNKRSHIVHILICETRQPSSFILFADITQCLPFLQWQLDYIVLYVSHCLTQLFSGFLHFKILDGLYYLTQRGG